MAKPILFHMSYSPSSRFALITAMHIGLDIEVRDTNLGLGDTNTPEYKAMNPTGTIPSLLDGDFPLFDSSAIAIYLVEKYAKEDSLYPKDLQLRAKVNEKLFYVGNYLFPRLYQLFVPAYYGIELEFPQTKVEEIVKGYQAINTFLESNEYLAGQTVTLADLYLWTLMESLGQVIAVDKEKFPNFDRWTNKMKELPTYEVNKKGADDHIAFYRACLQNPFTKP